MRNAQFAVLGLLLAASGVFAQSRTGTAQMSAEENYNQGRILEAAGRMPEATPFFDEAVRMGMAEISRGGAGADAYVFLARSLRRLGRHGEAVSWGRRGMQAFPGEYRLLETMGQSFFFLGNLEESLAHMERYASLMPTGENIPLAYFFMGEVFRLTGRFHRADMAYTTALRFAPAMTLWWFRLGTVREEVGDFPEAREAYAKALEISPGHNGSRNAMTRLDGNGN